MKKTTLKDFTYMHLVLAILILPIMLLRSFFKTIAIGSVEILQFVENVLTSVFQIAVHVITYYILAKPIVWLTMGVDTVLRHICMAIVGKKLWDYLTTKHD